MPPTRQGLLWLPACELWPIFWGTVLKVWGAGVGGGLLGKVILRPDYGVYCISSFWKKRGTEKWSKGVQIIHEIASVQRGQTESAHMYVGYDIGIIDEDETRADTVEVSERVVQCTML